MKVIFLVNFPQLCVAQITVENEPRVQLWRISIFCWLSGNLWNSLNCHMWISGAMHRTMKHIWQRGEKRIKRRKNRSPVLASQWFYLAFKILFTKPRLGATWPNEKSNSGFNKTLKVAVQTVTVIGYGFEFSSSTAGTGLMGQFFLAVYQYLWVTCFYR